MINIFNYQATSFPFGGLMDFRSFGPISNAFNTNVRNYNQNLSQRGVPLFNNFPGRVFNLGSNQSSQGTQGLGSENKSKPSNYYYNSGTAKDGSYVPPYTVGQDGRITRVGIKNLSEAQIPKSSEADAHFKRSIEQLDLKDTGKKDAKGRNIFERTGFVGQYVRGENGGIEFSGGHHKSNHNIKFEHQIYYNGYWYRLGDGATVDFGTKKEDSFTPSENPPKPTPQKPNVQSSGVGSLEQAKPKVPLPTKPKLENGPVIAGKPSVPPPTQSQNLPKNLKDAISDLREDKTFGSYNSAQSPHSDFYGQVSYALSYPSQDESGSYTLGSLKLTLERFEGLEGLNTKDIDPSVRQKIENIKRLISDELSKKQ